MTFPNKIYKFIYPSGYKVHMKILKKGKKTDTVCKIKKEKIIIN